MNNEHSYNKDEIFVCNEESSRLWVKLEHGRHTSFTGAIALKPIGTLKTHEHMLFNSYVSVFEAYKKVF